MAYGMFMLLNRYQGTDFLQLLYQGLAALVAVHALVLACPLGHLAGIGNYLDLLKIVPQSHFIVIRVMGRGNLYRTSTKGGVDILISKQRNLPVYYWQNQGLAHQLRITLVSRIYRHAGIAEHGLRTGGGNLHIPVLTLYLIADMPQMACLGLMLHLNVGNGGVAVRAPVGNACPLIDKPLLIQADKNLPDSPGAALVHGETLPVPIQRGTQGTQLAHDAAAELFLPLPYTLQELLPAQLVAVGAFLPESPLHLGLGSDTGMVAARHPQGIVALHAAPANQDVLQGIVQGMPHVQLAGYIWWRNHDAIRLLFLIHYSMKQLIFLPEAIPLLLKAFRVINLGNVIFFHIFLFHVHNLSNSFT